MNPAELNSVCEQISPLLVFYVCDEVDEGERAQIEQHLASCPACRAQFAVERNFQNTLISLPRDADRLDSAGVLLSQCRSELAENLDDLVRPPVLERTPVFGAFRRWMALRPAWSGAVLVAFGLLIGVQSSQWFAGRNAANPLDQAVNVRPGQHISDDQLSKMTVAGISFTPATSTGAQNVRLQLNAEQPVELTGSLDDPELRRVVTFVVKNGDRFDPGMRLDCLDALKTRAGDSEVRDALLATARKDQNPAVRLKALEALRDSSSDETVRAAFLDALKHDTNPGVRVEAVNLLVNSLDKDGDTDGGSVVLPTLPSLRDDNVVPAVSGGDASDASLVNVIRTLEDLRRKDPSRYVRLRSAAALRQISARNDQ
jgi:hypothetical protein